MISEVVCCDNIEYMKQFPDGYFNLAIADPPYNIGASSPSKKNTHARQKDGSLLPVRQSDYGNKEWDNSFAPCEYFEQLFRVSKKQIIWGGQYYGLSGGYLIWDKVTGNSDQFGCELAWLSFSKRTDIVYYLWRGMMQGVTCGKDIRLAHRQIGHKKLNEKRIHPTQKPVKLCKWILEEYSSSGSNILDPNAGSQSLRIACHESRINYFGCDNDQDIINTSNVRYQEYKHQQTLFQ